MTQQSKVQYLRGVFTAAPGTWVNQAVLDVLSEHDQLTADLLAARAEITELRSDLRAEQDRYEELLADSGGASSPPCTITAPGVPV